MLKPFYNSSLRRYIIMMSDLFSRIKVSRERDGVDGWITVPLTYASKEHFLLKLNSLNSINQDEVAKVETILPRMNLHLVDIQYNAMFKTAQLNRTEQLRSSSPASQYNPVPIKMIFELGIYTRHQDDMYQIVEQIIPYFQPHFTSKITELHSNTLKFTRDITITIQSISPDEQLDGESTSRRRLEWSIMFEVNGWIYPPVADVKGVIRTIYLDFYSNPIELNPEGEFMSMDFEVAPKDVEKEQWKANPKINESVTKNIPIPKDPEPSGIRK